MQTIQVQKRLHLANTVLTSALSWGGSCILHSLSRNTRSGFNDNCSSSQATNYSHKLQGWAACFPSSTLHRWTPPFTISNLLYWGLYSIKTVVIQIWQITQTASLLSTPRAKVKVNTQMEMKLTWAETAASQLCWWSPPRWDNCSVDAKKTNNRLINDNCIISVEWPQSKHLF